MHTDGKAYTAKRDSADEGKAICLPGPRPTRTQDVNITITGTRIVANGADLSGTPQLADFEAIYGKPDRVWDNKGSNRIHTWDKLGLIVYEPNNSLGRAISMTFPFRPMGMDYDPSTMFAGAIVIDGYSLSAANTLADAKTRPGATQPYGATSVVIAKGDFNVFLSTPKGLVDLVEVSLWKKGGPIAPPAPDGKTDGIAPADVKVEVTSAGNVTLLGKEIGGKPMLAEIKKILGEPSRVWDKKGGANRMHIWDNLGLIVYEPYNGRATSLTLPYKAMTGDFAPKSLFSGRVSLDSRGFYKFNTIGTIKQRPNATQPYGEDSVVFDFGDVHIFVKAAAATKEALDLVEVSFWQKNK